MHVRFKLLIAVCAIFVPAVSRAAVVNGDFETGDLTGWSFLGLGQAIGSSIGTGVTIPPPQGSFQGIIHTSGNGTVAAPVIAGALGFSGPTIAALGAGVPTVGSSISQDLTVNAGDVLSFDWNFLTDELNEDPMYNDYGFFSITTGASESAFLLASRNASTYSFFTPGDAYDGQTGWSTETYTFTSAGTFKLGFVVFNVVDAGHDSIFLLDNISLTPEPGSAMAMALAMTGAIYRRRK